MDSQMFQSEMKLQNRINYNQLNLNEDYQNNTVSLMDFTYTQNTFNYACTLEETNECSQLNSLSHTKSLNNSYLSCVNNNTTNSFTPIRFWRWFNEDDLEISVEIIANGNFGNVKKSKFINFNLFENNQAIIDSIQEVAIKETKGNEHNWIKEIYQLSHEVISTILFHPNLVNYIGGVSLGDATKDNPQRVGTIMEYIPNHLRFCIKEHPAFLNPKLQTQIAKQIASGVNFLHSLHPPVIVKPKKDLRTPNILLTTDLVCKIADFGISNNHLYEETNFPMYTSLIPPECIPYQSNFTNKGDVYFFGWILTELVLNSQPPSYDYKNIQTILQSVKNEQFIEKDLICKCLHPDPNQRPNFDMILTQLNYQMGTKYDLELIAKLNLQDVLEKGIESGDITLNKPKDDLERNIVHQCCIFGNLEMLKYLTNKFGVECLFKPDKFSSTLPHFAARNGYLEILSFLHDNRVSLNEKEVRYQTTALNLAIAMKHWKCIDFLISHASQENLDSALQSASQEGNLEVSKKLIAQGANLECKSLDNFSTPLDRASYSGHLDLVKFFIEKGANVNCTRLHDASTPLLNASQNGHLEVVKVLLENGADLQLVRSNYGDTALFMSAQNGHSKVVETLLKHGADPNKVDKKGSSPLIIASFKNHPETVSILLQYGANPDYKFIGKTAYDWARSVKNEITIQVFKEFANNKKYSQV